MEKYRVIWINAQEKRRQKTFKTLRETDAHCTIVRTDRATVIRITPKNERAKKFFYMGVRE